MNLVEDEEQRSCVKGERNLSFQANNNCCKNVMAMKLSDFNPQSHSYSFQRLDRLRFPLPDLSFSMVSTTILSPAVKEGGGSSSSLSRC